jgi:Holliday junction resolvase RusA-like endonuclease
MATPASGVGASSKRTTGTSAPERPVTDLERALAIRKFMAPNAEELHCIVVDTEPKSKARPRFGRGGRVYSSAESKQAETILAWHFRKSFKKPLEGNVAIGAIFFRPNRQRIDTDNMLKNVLDAANGIVVQDDSQVTGLVGIKEFDAERPRVVVVVCPHETTFPHGDRTTECRVCESTFTYKSNYATPPRACSPECAALWRKQALELATVPCANCQRKFRRRTAAQRFCSNECRYTDPARRKHPIPHCQDCGKRLSKPGYGRCRECWRKSFAKSEAPT